MRSAGIFFGPYTFPADGSLPRTSATLPTLPSSSRTLIPWGWDRERVRISLTVPRVLFPVRWSSFRTMSTLNPGFIAVRSLPCLIIAMIPGITAPGRKTAEPSPASPVCCTGALKKPAKQAPASGDSSASPSGDYPSRMLPDLEQNSSSTLSHIKSH